MTYPIKTRLVIQGVLTLVTILAVAYFICFTRFDVVCRVSYGIDATKVVASPEPSGLQQISAAAEDDLRQQETTAERQLKVAEEQLKITKELLDQQQGAERRRSLEEGVREYDRRLKERNGF